MQFIELTKEDTGDKFMINTSIIHEISPSPNGCYIGLKSNYIEVKEDYSKLLELLIK